MSALEIAVRQRKGITIDGAEYFISFPIRAVIALEEQLGRSMKCATDWVRIQTKELPAILAEGLRTEHPDAAEAVAAKVCDNLEPEAIEHVIDALCATACPKSMARIQEEMEKYRERVKRGLPPLPNVPGADAL